MNEKSNNRFQIVTLFIILLCIIPLTFLFFHEGTGFDIADEGFHLLASKYPNEVLIWPNVAYVYTGVLYQLAGENIRILRTISECLIFFSASFFSIALLKLIATIYPKEKLNNQVNLITWAMICLGALFYYTHFGLTPNYNTLNAISLYISSGFLFFSLACINLKKFKLSIIHSIACGLCMGIMLLVKFSTSFSLFLICSLIILLWKRIDFKYRLINIAFMLIGIITWLAVHVLFFQSWQSLIYTLHSGVKIFSDGFGHDPGQCLINYILETFRLFKSAIFNFWIYYFLLIAAILLIPKNQNTSFKANLILAIFILAGAASVGLNFYVGGTINSITIMEIYTSWLLLLILASTMALHHSRAEVILGQQEKQLIILGLYLFLLPYIGSVGTANVITLNMTQHMGAWLAIFVGLLYLTSSFLKNNYIFYVGSIIISIFACFQIITGGYISPYNLNTTIQAQNIPTTIGSTQFDLDQPTSNFFIKFKRIAELNNIKPNDDIIGFSNIAGIVYALGGKSPIVPFYPLYTGTKKMNTYFLKQMSSERLKRAYIIQIENSTFTIPEFSNFGIRFPQDYVLCGKATWPRTGEWVKLWKPKYLTAGHQNV